MFRALEQYQSSNEPPYIYPLRRPAWVLCKNCHPYKADMLKHFPKYESIHTYPVRCQVHVSIVWNAQLASSKAYKLCRGRKPTFISKADESTHSLTPGPLLSSSTATRPEDGWIPGSNCALSSCTSIFPCRALGPGPMAPYPSDTHLFP